MEKIVITTTCMNRREFLEKSLPTWLALGPPVVVLDYSSATPLPAYPGAIVARVDGQPHFNIGKAKNTAVRAALAAFPEAEFIFMVDADILVTRPDFFTLYQPLPDTFYQGAKPHTSGTAIYPAAAFKIANGHDERLVGYWSDEVDMYHRFRTLAGLKWKRMDWGLEHQAHVDRWANYPQPGSIRGNRDSGNWEDQPQDEIPFHFLNAVPQEGVLA